MSSILQEQAVEAYRIGYNCAQSVVSVFADKYGMNKEELLKVSSCFGGGMRMGATCGALTGSLMVLGLAGGYCHYNPQAKLDTETLCTNFIDTWKQRMGRTECKDILGLDPSNPSERIRGREEGVFDLHCPVCIQTAVELIEQFCKERIEQ